MNFGPRSTSSAVAEPGWRTWAMAALVCAAAILVYLPAMKAEFIWNDSDYVTAPELQSTEGLGRIWAEVGSTQQYYPLLHSAFWLEHRLWGDNPFGYHFVNVLLHAAAACLFAAVLRRLAVPGAWLAALLFALHPICVESVAWVTEQKNTLSLVFYLGAALAWLRFDASRARAPYLWGLALFVAALLTKTTTAVLPAALLVVTWWRRGRLEATRDVQPLVPWFVLGAALGLFSAWVEKHFIGAEGSDFALGFVQRCLLAGRIVWFYLAKLFLPFDLIFIYPRWTIDASAFAQWLFPLGLLALLGGLFWWWKRAAHRPEAAHRRSPLAVLLLFVGALFPVLGFFDVYGFLFSYVADHWQYLPCLPLIALAAALLMRVPKSARVLLVAVLGALSWEQSRLYADMDTFYRATLARNPDCWMAHNNLGSLLRRAGRNDEALAHYEATVRLKPDAAKAHDNLAALLRERKRMPEALEHLQAAVQLEPESSKFQDNLAGALRDSGRPRDALAHHREAVRLDPNSAAAHINYGVTLRDLGRGDEAIAQFEDAVRLKPDSAPAHLNLTLSYWAAGRLSDAEVHYREARRLNPAIPELDLSARPTP